MTFGEKSQLLIAVVVVAVVVSSLVNYAFLKLNIVDFSLSVDRVDENIGNSGEVLKLKITEIERILIKRVDDMVVGVVRRASPAVVSVIATRDIPVLERVFVDPFGDDELFKKLFGDSGFRIPQLRQKGTQKQDISSGSGFFVSSDGTVVTNKHVVADTEAEYSILTLEGERLDVKVLARDPLQDIAVLKVVSTVETVYPFLALSDSELQIGQTVIAIGNSLGQFQNTVSVGIVSGLHRSIVARAKFGSVEELREVIQTDAAINLGNSGGPLLNLFGEVIGINTAVAQDAENIGFALPVKFVTKDIEDIKRFGEIRYSFLGIRYTVINEKIREQLGLSVDYGALLTVGAQGEPAIFQGSPAEVVGLLEGDIILEFAGTRIDQENSLARLIIQRSVGDSVVLKVLREGLELTVQVTLVELPVNL